MYYTWVRCMYETSLRSLNHATYNVKIAQCSTQARLWSTVRISWLHWSGLTQKDSVYAGYNLMLIWVFQLHKNVRSLCLRRDATYVRLFASLLFPCWFPTIWQLDKFQSIITDKSPNWPSACEFGSQKYMPKEVAAAVAKNKALQEAQEVPALLATTITEVPAFSPPSSGGQKKKGVAQAPAVAQTYELHTWIGESD